MVKWLIFGQRICLSKSDMTVFFLSLGMNESLRLKETETHQSENLVCQRNRKGMVSIKIDDYLKTVEIPNLCKCIAKLQYLPKQKLICFKEVR